MPRGGRRPGAGAPKGNLNALTTGDRSYRLSVVIAAIITHPNQRALLAAIDESGALWRPRFGAPNRAYRVDVPALVQYLYPRLFDCTHPQAIKLNQTPPEITADPPQPTTPPDSRDIR